VPCRRRDEGSGVRRRVRQDLCAKRGHPRSRARCRERAAAHPHTSAARRERLCPGRWHGAQRAKRIGATSRVNVTGPRLRMPRSHPLRTTREGRRIRNEARTPTDRIITLRSRTADGHGPPETTAAYTR
jgi:hypothetical protein